MQTLRANMIAVRAKKPCCKYAREPANPARQHAVLQTWHAIMPTMRPNMTARRHALLRPARQHVNPERQHTSVAEPCASMPTLRANMPCCKHSYQHANPARQHALVPA